MASTLGMSWPWASRREWGFVVIASFQVALALRLPAAGEPNAD